MINNVNYGYKNNFTNFRSNTLTIVLNFDEYGETIETSNCDIDDAKKVCVAWGEVQLEESKRRLLQLKKDGVPL